MKRRIWFTLSIIAALIGIVASFQACGKAGGNGVGGNVQFYGAGS